MSEPLRLIPEDEPGPPGGVSARREHALQSLLELCRETSVALGVHETADLLLFNLMGQLRASRSAVWMFPDEEDASAPVLVRSHGFHRPVLDSLGSICAAPLRECFRRHARAALSWSLREELGAAPFQLVRHSAIAILAPLHARDEIMGWLALGERIDGSSYDADDLQILEAGLGIVSVSLQNARLYNRSREMNRRLRASNEHLSELDRLKTEFLSNVNHELRTPLAVVMGSLECLANLEGVDPRGHGLLEASLEQSKKLSAMIENLLTFSEAVDERLPVHLATDDAVDAVRACHEDRLPGVTAGLRELALRAASGIPPARFDRVRLLQVLNELIDNAAKFTPRGARIELGLDVVSDDGGTWVVIEISDNGPGIPAERLGTIFHSFEQVDGSATRRVGGLGMGLAFAHRLATCMKARLTASSDVGKGTTFRMFLPAVA